MALYKLAVTFCLAVCIGAAHCWMYFGPLVIFSATNDRPGCSGDHLLRTCGASAMEFAETPEGRQLDAVFSPVGGIISQIITENVFHNVCSIVQNAITCCYNWMDKCAPPEAVTNVQPLFRAARKIVSFCSFCNETDSYSKVTKTANCGQKLAYTRPVQDCTDNYGETVDLPFMAQISEITDNSSTAREELARHPTEFFLKRINLQKNACCYGKKIKKCLAPVMNSACTPDEQSLTEKFMERIMQALECTDDNSCSSIRIS